MTSIAGAGSTPPSPSEFGNAIEHYAHIFSAATPRPDQIAKETIALSKQAHTVMTAASPVIKKAAADLEKLLETPVSIPEKPQGVSILTAAQHYMDNPTTAELEPLIKELYKNSLALKCMREELNLLSNSIKNPSAPGR